MQVPWPIALGVVSIEKLIPWIYRDMPFLAVSESSKQDLVGRGVPAERIDLLYNGIVFPGIEPPAVTRRPCRLAYLGRLEPYKRVELLLRALAALVPRFPELDLVVVGRGAEAEALARQAAELGVAERVRFTGFVSDAERDAALAQARVCVCPSVKEGWGITVIEANALGLPVVATDAPGLRDAVRHGETGLLVPDGPPDTFSAGLADAVGRLLADEPQLARLSAGARRWARRFDWDVSARKMAQVIEALCQGSPAR